MQKFNFSLVILFLLLVNCTFSQISPEKISVKLMAILPFTHANRKQIAHKMTKTFNLNNCFDEICSLFKLIKLRALFIFRNIP